MNYLPLIKGFCLSFLAWLGITITTPNGWLYIHIAEGSAGWYIIYALCLLMLVSGVHKIYTFCRRRLQAYFRCLRLRNILKARKFSKTAKDNSHINLWP